MTKGGAFLIEDTKAQGVFTPEDFTEEHRMIAATAAEFVQRAAVPRRDAIEAKEPGLMVALLKQAGELGLLAVDIPEEYEGLGLDKISTLLVTENIVAGGSFAIAHGAHTGIGTLPILFYGNDEQKERYLATLATGEKIAAYALTEPEAGSDALSARTRAVLNDAGTHYVLNGTKQFITNAGIADVFITYARVDGDKFTAFIVERDTPGLSVGPEEHKMGIEGSSTRPLSFEDAQVPAGNVLGEVGRGHVVAFNILNLGRFKLAAGCVGSAKLALAEAARYAGERRQFGKVIGSFGLIKEKLARMAAAVYAAESMVYRTGGLIEAAAHDSAGGAPATADVARAIEEFAIECSINKVYASEALDLVADQALQVFGGYGYIKEYLVERIYRDSRINRIFEGTNEINRLLIPDQIMRRAQKGRLAVMEAMARFTGDVFSIGMQSPDEARAALESPLGPEGQALAGLKKAFLMVAGLAVQRYALELAEEQEILGVVSDLVIETYALESAILRAEKELQAHGAEAAALKIDLVRYLAGELVPRIGARAAGALAAMAAGDELRMQTSLLNKLTRFLPADRIAAGRRTADRVLAAGGYKV